MWTSAKDKDGGEKAGVRARTRVGTVRATIYVARLPETLQEQFITDIRAIWKARTLL